MSAQRKLISIFAYTPHHRLAVRQLHLPRSSFLSSPSRSRSRSIVTSSTLFRPAQAQGAKGTSESTKDDTKPVPSEQITEEAKKAEPDAVEQVEKMEKKGLDPLPTQT